MFQILTELESEVGVASREVQNLTEHIWLEAIGEVEAVLASPISSVKVEEAKTIFSLLCACVYMCACVHICT